MNSTEMPAIALLATTAFGLEAVVSRELKQLGYESRTVQPGRVEVIADLVAICRLNLHLRCAERVLVRVGEFEADDFGKLFDGTAALPWEKWIPADGQFPVRGRSIKSQLSSVPACQRMVKKAIATRLAAGHGVEELVESGAEYRVEVALLKDQVTLTLDTTGDGLHKRGYRPIAGKAALRETLAAAMVLLSYWRRDRQLIDPFCGTGTIPIEAAMIGRHIAPGLNRSFVSEAWPMIPTDAWEAERAAARKVILPPLPIRIRASDTHEGALGLARRNAAAAGVEDDVHFQAKAFADVTSKKSYGCIITNPPYGQRMGSKTEIYDLYRSFPVVLRKFPTWSHYVITSFEDFEKVIGQKANRRRKLYNGRIECQYFQFHGPRPPKNESGTRQTVEELPSVEVATNEPLETTASTSDALTESESRPRETMAPAFGGLKEESSRQSEEFGNRLRKRARHLRRWPKRGITCYRLYERDIPEIPLVVDRYEDCLHIAEFARPHDRTPAQHHDWLDLMATTASEALEVDRSNVFVKFRDRQRGASQYQRHGQSASTFVVNEGGLRFKVNLSDYIDTGLFLDHRIARQMVREEADQKRFLNLFAYTGAFSVYAAAGGAASTTTVDLSKTYLEWAEENFALNELNGNHRFAQSDVLEYLDTLQAGAQFDLAVVDPPTFSNSKGLERDWDVQKDHVELLAKVFKQMAPEGVVYFSNNFRRFKLRESELIDQFSGVSIREISQKTVPEDFRNRRIHRCWRMQLAK